VTLFHPFLLVLAKKISILPQSLIQAQVLMDSVDSIEQKEIENASSRANIKLDKPQSPKRAVVPSGTPARNRFISKRKGPLNSENHKPNVAPILYKKLRSQFYSPSIISKLSSTDTKIPAPVNSPVRPVASSLITNKKLTDDRAAQVSQTHSLSFGVSNISSVQMPPDAFDPLANVGQCGNKLGTTPGSKLHRSPRVNLLSFKGTDSKRDSKVNPYVEQSSCAKEALTFSPIACKSSTQVLHDNSCPPNPANLKQLEEKVLPMSSTDELDYVLTNECTESNSGSGASTCIDETPSFSTGTGKKISILPQSLIQAQALMESVDREVEDVGKPQSPKHEVGIAQNCFISEKRESLKPVNHKSTAAPILHKKLRSQFSLPFTKDISKLPASVNSPVRPVASSLITNKKLETFIDDRNMQVSQAQSLSLEISCLEVPPDFFDFSLEQCSNKLVTTPEPNCGTGGNLLSKDPTSGKLSGNG